MGQVGNFKREYLANGSEWEAHFLNGKRAYMKELLPRSAARGVTVLLRSE